MAKYFSETPLVESGMELQFCDLTTNKITDFKYMVCFRKPLLGKRVEGHFHVIYVAILAVVAAGRDGGSCRRRGCSLLRMRPLLWHPSSPVSESEA